MDWFAGAHTAANRLWRAQTRYYSGSELESRTTSLLLRASERLTGNMLRSFCILGLSLALTAAAAPAQKGPKPASTPAADPTADLQRDSHNGLTVMANPLTDPARAKDLFGKANPINAGLLPVEVFLKNENAQPLRVNIDTIRLVVHLKSGGRQDLDWLSVQEVAALIAHPGGIAPKDPRRVAGIPLPSGDKKTDKLVEILQPLSLDGEIVAGNSTLHGYLYFDVSHELKLADTASIYVPDAFSMPSNKPLMFFEVPVGKKPADQ